MLQQHERIVYSALTEAWQLRLVQLLKNTFCIQKLNSQRSPGGLRGEDTNWSSVWILLLLPLISSYQLVLRQQVDKMWRQWNESSRIIFSKTTSVCFSLFQGPMSVYKLRYATVTHRSPSSLSSLIPHTPIRLILAATVVVCAIVFQKFLSCPSNMT